MLGFQGPRLGFGGPLAVAHLQLHGLAFQVYKTGK